MNTLVVIASYGHLNDVHLQKVAMQWKSQGGTEVIVLSNEPKAVPWANLVEVVDDLADPTHLPFRARPILARNVELFDWFVYSEDDMLITDVNMKALRSVTKERLRTGEVAGFLRYELTPQKERRFPDMHGAFHWENGIEDRSGMHFARYSNQHQGCYVLNQEQLRRAVDSGGFLVEPHHTAVYGTLECGASDPFLQCGLDRLISISRFDDFLIHHLPNKYVDTFGKPEGEVLGELYGLAVRHA